MVLSLLMFLTGLYSESDDSSNVSGPEEELLQAALEQRLDEDHMISSEYEGSEVEDSEEESEGKQDRHGSTHDETMSEDEEGGDEGESDEERGEGAEFEEKAAAGDQRQEGGGVSLFAVNNDVEKGKAAREQLSELEEKLNSSVCIKELELRTGLDHIFINPLLYYIALFVSGNLCFCIVSIEFTEVIIFSHYF